MSGLSVVGNGPRNPLAASATTFLKSDLQMMCVFLPELAQLNTFLLLWVVLAPLVLVGAKPHSQVAFQVGL